MSGKSRGAEPIGRKVCSGTGGAVQNTGTREMDDAKGFSLGERQFLEFAFPLIGFRLTVGCAGELIVRVKRAGGPLAKTIIRKRRAQELHRADREQKEKQPVPGDTNHDLPPRKSNHRTMSSPPSAIPPDFHATQAASALLKPANHFHQSISPSHVVRAGPYWGYPESRPFCGRHYSASPWCGSVGR